jgi:hypothetical protein
VPATRKCCTKHAPSPKTECGHLNGGKSKAVIYAFPPGYRENAEEDYVARGSMRDEHGREGTQASSNHFTIIRPCWCTSSSLLSLHLQFFNYMWAY